MIQGSTRLYAIVGDPVAHVRVPLVFNPHFDHIGADAACVAIHIGADEIDAGWAGLKAMRNLDGFIVTAPHKAAAARLCDRVEGDARMVGAVNTVRREADGTLTGTLFDGDGFVAGLRRHGHEVGGKRVYLAGAGGAGNALAFALAGAGVAAMTLHNRTRARAEDLAARLRQAFRDLEVTLGDRTPDTADIAINATSLGLEPDDALPFELETLAASTLVAEVIMQPERTKLLELAAAKGCPTHGGRPMLMGQLGLMMRFFGFPPPQEPGP